MKIERKVTVTVTLCYTLREVIIIRFFSPGFRVEGESNGRKKEGRMRFLQGIFGLSLLAPVAGHLRASDASVEYNTSGGPKVGALPPYDSKL